MILRKMILLSSIAALTLIAAPAAALGEDSGADDGITVSSPETTAPKKAADSSTAGDDKAISNQDDAAASDSVKKPPPKKMDWTFPLIMIGVFVLMYVWMGRGKKKREAKRRDMLASLKKGDKVTSIGGIVGTVVEVREDEVAVKVDENNNIRMRFARWAIRGVGDQAKTKAPEDK